MDEGIANTIGERFFFFFRFSAALRILPICVQVNFFTRQMVEQLPCVEYNEHWFRWANHSEMNQCLNCGLHIRLYMPSFFHFVRSFFFSLLLFSVFAHHIL